MALTRIFRATYSSSLNAGEIWKYVLDKKPRVILMESFCAPESHIEMGGIIDYEKEYGTDTMKQLLEVGTSAHKKWTGELAAVVAGVSVGSEFRFCDRFHEISFNRFINRNPKAELVLELLQALDTIQDADDSAQHISRAIPELWVERHQVMSHIIKRQQKKYPGEELLSVIGSAHADSVELLLNAEETSSLDDLLVNYPPTYTEDDLDKRLAVAALLSTTMAFHPSTVVSPEDVPEDQKEHADRVYNNYRNTFRRRLEDNIPGSQSRDIAPTQEQLLARVASRYSGRSVGLLQLPRLCNELEMVRQAKAS
eukprot:TRINITY_DN481_c8_g1_i1.p1 TRINITY_DN481_c8_g1~~TRINITY_DN481_c8_g1_i1.p1  ORF type:complete len:311 (+),score=40.41 TRINITY_DN481_c8_g1_i1:35-967(+)